MQFQLVCIIFNKYFSNLFWRYYIKGIDNIDVYINKSYNIGY